MDIILSLIIGLLLAIIGLLIALIGSNRNKKIVNNIGLIILLISPFIAMGLICLIFNIERNNPQAIDVYRGNTTLEITYRDSVPVDSVVVFKNK